MNHKILFLMSIFLFGGLLSGCGVELRDNKAKAAPERKELHVNQEFVVPATVAADGKVVYHYDRLVLSEGAAFTTNGANIRLEIGELIADHAVIRTFAPDAKAPLGQDGRNGGSLEIIVGSGSGDLTVEMRGEAGGDGIPGANPDERLRGPTGNPGTDCRQLSAEKGLWHYQENGETGKPGQPGYSGGTGKNGGDTGILNLVVQNNTDLRLRVNRIAGPGGVGGKGGAGGPGGFGGAPGKSKNPDTGIICPAHGSESIAGPLGPIGPEGIAGQAGREGYPESACSQLSSEEQHCE